MPDGNRYNRWCVEWYILQHYNHEDWAIIHELTDADKEVFRDYRCLYRGVPEQVLYPCRIPKWIPENVLRGYDPPDTTGMPPLCYVNKNPRLRTLEGPYDFEVEAIYVPDEREPINTGDPRTSHPGGRGFRLNEQQLIPFVEDVTEAQPVYLQQEFEQMMDTAPEPVAASQDYYGARTSVSSSGSGKQAAPASEFQSMKDALKESQATARTTVGTAREVVRTAAQKKQDELDRIEWARLDEIEQENNRLVAAEKLKKQQDEQKKKEDDKKKKEDAERKEAKKREDEKMAAQKKEDERLEKIAERKRKEKEQADALAEEQRLEKEREKEQKRVLDAQKAAQKEQQKRDDYLASVAERERKRKDEIEAYAAKQKAKQEAEYLKECKRLVKANCPSLDDDEIEDEVERWVQIMRTADNLIRKECHDWLTEQRDQGVQFEAAVITSLNNACHMARGNNLIPVTVAMGKATGAGEYWHPERFEPFQTAIRTLTYDMLKLHAITPLQQPSAEIPLFGGDIIQETGEQVLDESLAAEEDDEVLVADENEEALAARNRLKTSLTALFDVDDDEHEDNDAEEKRRDEASASTPTGKPISFSESLKKQAEEMNKALVEAGIKASLTYEEAPVAEVPTCQIALYAHPDMAGIMLNKVDRLKGFTLEFEDGNVRAQILRSECVPEEQAVYEVPENDYLRIALRQILRTRRQHEMTPGNNNTQKYYQDAIDSTTRGISQNIFTDNPALKSAMDAAKSVGEVLKKCYAAGPFTTKRERESDDESDKDGQTEVKRSCTEKDREGSGYRSERKAGGEKTFKTPQKTPYRSEGRGSSYSRRSQEERAMSSVRQFAGRQMHASRLQQRRPAMQRMADPAGKGESPLVKQQKEQKELEKMIADDEARMGIEQIEDGNKKNESEKAPTENPMDPQEKNREGNISEGDIEELRDQAEATRRHSQSNKRESISSTGSYQTKRHDQSPSTRYDTIKALIKCKEELYRPHKDVKKITLDKKGAETVLSIVERCHENLLLTRSDNPVYEVENRKLNEVSYQLATSESRKWFKNRRSYGYYMQRDDQKYLVEAVARDVEEFIRGRKEAIRRIKGGGGGSRQ